MEKDELYLIQLRDCFTAGYTLPQFCIDNNIKKPLFVTEKKFFQFAWEVHVQFKYDKRITVQFSFLDLSANEEIRFSVRGIIGPLKHENFSNVNFADFDAIILLTMKQADIPGRVIPLNELRGYFINKTYAEIPALNFLQRHPQVKLILTGFPLAKDYRGGTQFNKGLTSYEELGKIIRAHRGKNKEVEHPLSKFGYTVKDVNDLIGAPKIKANLDGSTLMLDSKSSLMNIKNNKRETADQPETYLNRIYFFGTCHDYGINAPYDKTIASYLQKMLNENNLPYRVENESQRFARRYQDIFYNLNNLDPKPGDIIFLYLGNLRAESLPFLNLRRAFAPPLDYKEFFCIKSHVNELGYKVLAEKYFEFLTKNNFFRDEKFNYKSPPPVYHRYGIPQQFEQGGGKSFVNEELETYKKTLREKKVPIGALVMNCNPFTLGHQYLVEYAASRVVKLYLFVVEEDKSEFPFADRIELVKQGVKNFSNVEVLPSGKFIISQQTFSGYFNKAELQDVQVDSSEDVEIFGKEIAPTLGITIRFAGEEPTDNVTRQYNETMKKILPRYGVEFCEIPRKTFGDEIISASKVRAALKVGDFDKIKNLVPETTFLYLLGRKSVKPASA